MHIPDGFLDAKTAVVTGGLAVAGVGVALQQARLHLPARRVPLLGLAAAVVFAAQMLNFPVLAGTSGHLLGGVLAAVLLGPGAAAVVMTAVVILQCLLFSDGGVTALGANIFNMALVAPVGGYGIYRCVRRGAPGLRGLVLGAAFAGWCATVLAATSCAGQLALAGRAAWAQVLPAMVGVHMVIGIGEGAITALVLVGVARARPELIEDGAPASLREDYRQVLGYGLVFALGLALFVAPFACEWPDGLEKVAAQLGFAPVARPAEPWLNVPLAGAVGTLLAFALAWLLARALVPRTAKD